MMDIIAAFIFGVMFAINVAVLVGLAKISVRTKLKAIGLSAVWASAVMTIAALGGFAPGSVGRFPAPVLAFAVLVASGAIGWMFSAAFRNALQSIPVAALIGVNAFRIAGVFFVLLTSQGRLSEPFGPVAGWGDIIAGLVAIPLAVWLATGKSVSGWALAAWNAFGALDLVVALSLAFLSAPGSPFQIFKDGNGTEVLTHAPWIAAATMLVPLYLFTHLTIASQLRSSAEERGDSVARLILE
jgi:hypothetical protein